MAVKQVSVFIENRKGRLEEVTKVLSDYAIDIITFSLADTSEFGVLRMIVSDPEKAKSCLKNAGFSANISQVIAVKVPNNRGMLQRVLQVVATAESNVQYMYILSTGENASIVLKVSDPDKVEEAMQQAKMELYDEEQVYNFRS